MAYPDDYSSHNIIALTVTMMFLDMEGSLLKASNAYAKATGLGTDSSRPWPQLT